MILLDKKNRFFAISGLLLMVTAIFSSGYHHFDEHFQILEFAGLKLGLTKEAYLPWEYHNQMRSAFQPFLVVLLYKGFSFLGINNPFLISTALRLLSALLSFYAMLLLYKSFSKKIIDKNLAKWFMLLSFFLWWWVYNSVRFSSENWAGCFLIIGLALYFLKKPAGSKAFVLIGFLFGLSFLCRFQMALSVFGFLLWLVIIKKESWSALGLIIIGGLMAFGLGVLIDYWYYGEWTLSAWNYVDQNLLQDKVNGFGESPWWSYLTGFLERGIPPFSLLFILSFFYLLIRKWKEAVLWVMLPFLLVHFLIGHKELRFLFPMIAFLPILLALTLSDFPKLIASKWSKYFMGTFFLVNTLVLIVVMLKPADSQIGLYEELWDNHKEKEVLYFASKNPFDRVLDIRFYKQEGLRVVQYEKGTTPINGAKELLVLTQQEELADFQLKGKLLYSSMPQWLSAFNFNGWQERTASWKLYEIE